MSKTIHEIKAAFGDARTALLQDYYRELDGVRAIAHPDTPHADKLTAEGRAEILVGQKNTAKDEARGRALERYREATGEHREAAEARTAFLDKSLYHVADGRLVADAAGATDEGLERLMRAAARTNNGELAKAVFGEADARGLSGLVNAYLEGAGPETAELYAERQAAPSPEELDKHEAQAEMFVHDPEPGTLRYGPRVAS